MPYRYATAEGKPVCCSSLLLASRLFSMVLHAGYLSWTGIKCNAGQGVTLTVNTVQHWQGRNTLLCDIAINHQPQALGRLKVSDTFTPFHHCIGACLDHKDVHI